MNTFYQSAKSIYCTLLVCIVIGSVQMSYGQLFQQGFNTACSTQAQINAAYVNAAPDNHKFTAIGTTAGSLSISVSGNALKYNRSGSSGTGTFSRIAAFN